MKINKLLLLLFLLKVGGILAQIKIFFLQKCFVIGSSIRFQTGVTFEEKLYIITEGWYSYDHSFLFIFMIIRDYNEPKYFCKHKTSAKEVILV